MQKNRVLDTYSRRVELDPGPETHRVRAAALEEVGDWGAALADLDRVLAASPDDVDALARRAQANERFGRTEEALRDSDRALALCRRLLEDPDGDRARARRILGTALRARARARVRAGMPEIEGAWTDWREMLAQSPEDLEASAQLCWLWIVRRCAAHAAPAPPDEADGDEDADRDADSEDDARLALACAERTHRASPGDPVSLRDLGAILCHLGRLDEAQPLLEEAWRGNRGLFSALLHLAVIEHHGGRTEEARRLYEEATVAGRARLPEATPIRGVFETVRAYVERRLVDGWAGSIGSP
jgi:tetratricopeptide (TPR) repeat protein